MFNEEAFLEEMNMKRQFVDNCLEKMLNAEDDYPPIIHKAMRYAVFNGGKRLRPVMLLEGARIAGGIPQMVIPAACAIEMIHSYSLVHDDLPAMDDDEMRRGKPTCHIVFGEANAILTGDALLTAAFELLTQNAKIEGVKPENVLRAIEQIAQAAGSRGMIGGQVVDLESEGKNIDMKTLKTLHSLKTGELFRAAVKAGAILCGMKEKGILALDDYARSFGLAFQITDDILDVQGDSSLIGKPVGSDQKNAKITYPGLIGMDKSYELASEAVEDCIKCLSIFGEDAEFLKNLALYILNRKY